MERLSNASILASCVVILDKSSMPSFLDSLSTFSIGAAPFIDPSGLCVSPNKLSQLSCVSDPASSAWVYLPLIISSASLPPTLSLLKNGGSFSGLGGTSVLGLSSSPSSACINALSTVLVVPAVILPPYVISCIVQSATKSRNTLSTSKKGRRKS